MDEGVSEDMKNCETRIYWPKLTENLERGAERGEGQDSHNLL